MLFIVSMEVTFAVNILLIRQPHRQGFYSLFFYFAIYLFYVL